MTTWTSPSVCLCLYVLVNPNFPQSISISITSMSLGLLNNVEFEDIAKVTLCSLELIVLDCQILFFSQKGKT